MNPANRPGKPGDTRASTASPVVLIFWAMALVNLALAHFAFGGYAPSVGGDAAGNAMSTAFEKLFMIAALGLVGLLATLFLLIRRQGFRIALVIILVLNSFLLLTILSLQF
jgi:hypothetical protein